MRVLNLKTEYKNNPLGIDVRKPRFGWMLQSHIRSQGQTAYRIIVASNLADIQERHGTVWDSGKVVSDRNVHVEYDGIALRSNTLYYWAVQAWDRTGNPTAWSESALFSTGLFHSKEWLAKWIGMTGPSTEWMGEEGLSRTTELCPYVRKKFHMRRPIVRATVFSSALGLYTLQINGKRVSEDYFAPGWTDYNTRVQYQTYDVTSLLKTGDNVAAALLGSGWYAGHVASIGKYQYGTEPYFLFQLHVEYDDGSAECIVSDESWKTSEGPLSKADIIMGEMYDARREQAGWCEPGFNDSEWESVGVKSHTAKLVSQVDPPVRITEEITPSRQYKRSEMQTIYDLGQNIAGWVRIVLTGPAGSKVTLRYGERLDQDSGLYMANLRGALQTDIYILKGDKTEAYAPQFTYHGFQYVEITVSSEEVAVCSVVGQVVHSALAMTGSLITSNPMVNRLQSNIVWSGRDNFLSVPTDCPQRDERWGWTGDSQVFIRTASYNMDIASFFRKYMIDMMDAQQPNGNFHIVNPEGGLTRYLASLNDPYNLKLSPGWGDAGVIIPWTLYQVYEDHAILQEHYESYRKWIRFVLDVSEDYIVGEYGFGDWLSVGAETPKDVIATAYFAYSTSIMANISKALGKEEEAKSYTELFGKIRSAFNEAFVGPDGRIKGDTQAAYVLAIQMNLLSTENERRAIHYLVEDIENHGGHLTTGFLGVSYLLPVLTRGGRTDVAYRLLLQDTFPSWGYSIKHGATTIWERWDGWTEEHGFQDPGMNSLNHYSLGSVGEWLYRTVAGIDAAPGQPGFKQIVIRPMPGGELTYARGEFESIYGKIISHWELSEDNYRLNVTIPVNTTATVYVKAKNGNYASLFVNGEPALQAAVVTWTGFEGDQAVFHVGSGEYEFICYRT
ncbi:glycoside hydrolase family 78 protein [Paenibacillus sp. PAMC21692]|uniref:glycoside hydrolase family 78 protein n=1 Tax=Paenibacillus sp. PAMC21692 TaxID=2762320 RepID=UPI00164D79D6|nr:glycoside hydrolase family 78 protein [Paenibacillus sp. PAMC21692]QNK58948.1 glycoside hydrolase family 78 protein [Paenibacillus sp. PAMC21692]